MIRRTAVFVFLMFATFASASDTGEVINGLKAYCKDKWARDYDMQTYCFDKQVEGVSDLKRLSDAVKIVSAEGETPSPDKSETPKAPQVRDDVREAQRLLNTLGYDAGAPDGIFGPKTREAIETFNYVTGQDGLAPVVDAKLLMRLRAKVKGQ